MKRKADMMQPEEEQLLHIHKDILKYLSKELFISQQKTVDHLFALKLAPEQNAILLSTDSTVQKDVLAALRLTDEQIESLSHALFIHIDIVSFVQQKHNLPTLDASRRFLIELHRHHIIYPVDGKPLAIAPDGHSVLVDNKTGSDQRGKQLARADYKRLSGYRSYADLNEVYSHLKDESHYTDKFSYLLHQYSSHSPKPQLSDDARVKNLAIDAARNNFPRSCQALSMHNETVREKMRARLLKSKQRGVPASHINEYANYYLEEHSTLFWTAAEYIYTGLKNPLISREQLLNLHPAFYTQIFRTPKPSESLMNEVNANSTMWENVLDITRTIIHKDRNRSSTSAPVRWPSSTTKPSKNNNNNNNNNNNSNNRPHA